MLKKESTDMFQADIARENIMEGNSMERKMSGEGKIFQGEVQFAVKVDSLNKSFTRWQRKENILQEGNNSAKENNSQRKRIFGKEKIKNIFRQEKKTVTALDNVSFRVRRGEFVAYAGPNGAGKSTTMKLLSGILKPTAGSVSVLGMSPEKDRIALMKKLGVLFGNRTELWWDHPVIQSFEWKKVVWDIPDAVYRRNLDMVTELLDIGGIRNTFARELSLGQRMRADLAMMMLKKMMWLN